MDPFSTENQSSNETQEQHNTALVNLFALTANWSKFYDIDPSVRRGTTADFYQFMAEGIAAPRGSKEILVAYGVDALRVRSDLIILPPDRLEEKYIRYLLLEEFNLDWKRNKALARIFAGLKTSNDRLTALYHQAREDFVIARPNEETAIKTTVMLLKGVCQAEFDPADEELIKQYINEVIAMDRFRVFIDENQSVRMLALPESFQKSKGERWSVAVMDSGEKPLGKEFQVTRLSHEDGSTKTHNHTNSRNLGRCFFEIRPVSLGVEQNLRGISLRKSAETAALSDESTTIATLVYYQNIPHERMAVEMTIIESRGANQGTYPKAKVSVTPRR